ncbi:2OG-Fe(II) oxygenase [Marinobacterium sp. AK62]|uniref:2OG-Fe(II) oxygenase n=1 Tax=Marinobacterium alkalitolerans TaxID=1542925 RepID=A0ABS3ZDF5_9GAMM|nr:2OG-Fe(II) oxygenase [Marinobacterium alkalitolerans]MBP0049732.1 2OG-Fe(II) oxygenase [Marinobacterium alkalitolerans]
MTAMSHPLVLSQEPRIEVLDAGLSPDECTHLINLARPLMQRARVSAGKAGVLSARRSGSNCWLKHNADPVVEAVCRRISRWAGLSLSMAESLQVIYYAQGQEYAPHYDGWDPNTERGRRCLKKGQRVLTALCYLNTVKSGGETAFPKLDLMVEAEQGRLVFFSNVHQNSLQRHPDSLHGGLPVIEGEKWACNLWFRTSYPLD